MAAEPARFRYRAQDAAGQSQTGTLDASSVGDASRQLQQRGLLLLQVTALQDDLPTAPAGRRRAQITAMDRIVLLREIGTLLESGVALAEALSSLALAYRGRGPGPAVAQVDQAVRNGAALSQAFAQSTVGLPQMALALIHAGEATGQMAPALLDASNTLEDDLRLRRELRNAMTYPLVLVGAGVAAVLVIFVAVVPRFASTLRNPRADLPAMSRWVIESGVWVQAHWLYVTLAAAAAVLIAAVALAQPSVRRGLFDRLAGGPPLGPWIVESQVGRWAAGLAALLANKVPIADALRLSALMTELGPMAAGIQRCARDVEQGRTISESLRGASWLSPTALNLVRVGERSGSLDRMLAAVGKMNRESAVNRQRQVLALIEPVAILLIAAVIAVIMISVMMAITSMGNIAV